MRFHVSGPTGTTPVIANTPEEALRAGSKMVALSKGHESLLAQLREGKRAAWAYGFSEVWIEPIRQHGA